MSGGLDWQRLAEQFDALCELDAGARAQALDKLRRDQPELAQELARMLDADARENGVLDQGVEAIAAVTVAVSARDRSGQQLGEFVLTERIGRGGMGEVYRAERRASDFEQAVAIKLLRAGLDGADAERRFARERRILARLEHPGIARLIDGGMDTEGVPWLAMELVDGQTLTAYAKSAALSLDQRLQLVIEVCAAVDYAHRRLIVHRDLKPSNVLVDGQGRVKLLDFGIAKLLDEEEAPAMTASGVRLMSPAYAAPEQILGEAISTATDVYALGLLLCELLTARLPQKRGQQSLEALARSLDADEIERPSALVDAAVRDIPAHLLVGDLDNIVCKALSREPERRYASAVALAEDIQRFRDGRPIAARPDTFGYRMGKFVRRHRGSVGASLLALLALLIGFGSALWQADVARTQARLAEAQRVRAEAQAERAERIKDFLIALFKDKEPVGRAGAKPKTPLGMIESGIVAAQRDLKDDPELRDEVLGDLADVGVNLGGAETAAPLLEESLSYRRQHYGDAHRLVASVLGSQVTAMFQKGKFSEAEPKIAEAQAILTAIHGPEHIDVANMENRMVRVLISQTRLDEAAVLMREVVRKTEAHYGAGHAELGLRLSNLGVVLMQMGQDEAAQVEFERAIAVLERAYGPEHAALGFPLTNLGDLQRRRGLLAEALATYERDVAITLSQLGNEHPAYAVSLQRLGNAQRMNRDFKAAETTLGRALAIQEKGKYNELADTYSRLSNLAADRDDADTAIARATQAHAHALATQGIKSRLTWTRLGFLGATLAEAGRTAASSESLEQAIAGLQALGEPAIADVAMHQVQLGSVRRQRGELDQAIELQELGLRTLEARVKATDGRVDTARVALSLSLLMRAGSADVARAQALLGQVEPRRSALSPNAHAALELARALEHRLAGDRAEALAALDRLDALIANTGLDGRWLRAESKRIRPELKS